MSSTTELQETQTHGSTMGVDSTSELMLHGALDGDATSLCDRRPQRPARVISEYLGNEAPEFRRLSELRQIVSTYPMSLGYP